MTDKLRFIDTHAHIDFDVYQDDFDVMLEQSAQSGIEKIIIPGVTIKESHKIIEIIDKYEHIYGAVALHPSDVKDWDENSYKTLKEYAGHPKIVAIGETGLDYYWDKSNIELQKQVFKEHIRLALELNLPLIVHNRDAHADTLSILKENGADKTGGVMHCFSGSAEFAKECTDFGFFIALGGPVTFKNARKPKEVAEEIPLNRLLLETDSPFLTPDPHRGKRNDPAMIVLIAEKVAEIKGISLTEVAENTSLNAERLFGFQNKH